MGVGTSQDQGTERAHFTMQQADCVGLCIVGPEAVGADQFCQIVRLVLWRAFNAAHFRQADSEACLRQLPSRL